ncbi:hypothetical protein ODC56_004503 [Salmonella enterica]|nr:hypothetical protein [Salmonella enterica]EJX0413049.1 hypothetical protein [Salmonella enterica]
MYLLRYLFGHRFLQSLREARETEQTIRTGGKAFTEKCPPAMIAHFTINLSVMQSVPNPVPFVMACFLLMLGCIANLHFFFTALSLFSVPTGATLMFISIIPLVIYLTGSFALINKGFLYGLYNYAFFLIGNFIFSCVLLIMLWKNGDYHNVGQIAFTIVLVLLCRWIINGDTYNMMIRFVLARRLVRVAHKKYSTSIVKKGSR